MTALDATALPAQKMLQAAKGQSRPERGFRFLKGLRLRASLLYLKKPECIITLLKLMTVRLLVYAALNRPTQHWPAGSAHDHKVPARSGHQVYESHLD